MKIAKIMLMAIAVFATVGGALAFKAKAIGGDKYCYLITPDKPAIGFCTSTAINALVDPALPMASGFYTTTQDVSQCNLADCAPIGVPNAN